jgi:hypothetical protein
MSIIVFLVQSKRVNESYDGISLQAYPKMGEVNICLYLCTTRSINFLRGLREIHVDFRSVPSFGFSKQFASKITSINI